MASSPQPWRSTRRGGRRRVLRCSSAAMNASTCSRRILPATVGILAGRNVPFSRLGGDRRGDGLAGSGWMHQEASDPLCSPTLVVGASIFVSAT